MQTRISSILACRVRLDKSFLVLLNNRQCKLWDGLILPEKCLVFLERSVGRMAIK